MNRKSITIKRKRKREKGLVIKSTDSYTALAHKNFSFLSQKKSFRCPRPSGSQSGSFLKVLYLIFCSTGSRFQDRSFRWPNLRSFCSCLLCEVKGSRTVCSGQQSCEEKPRLIRSVSIA